jgi:3-dehydroquinate synthase II
MMQRSISFTLFSSSSSSAACDAGQCFRRTWRSHARVLESKRTRTDWGFQCDGLGEEEGVDDEEERAQKKKKKKKEKKVFLVQTKNVECAIVAVESGSLNAFVLDWMDEDEYDVMKRIGAKDVFVKTKDFEIRTKDLGGGEKYAEYVEVRTSEDVLRASKMRGVVVVDVVSDKSSWRVIPAENLVAASNESKYGVRFISVCETAEDALEQLEALEIGVSGVILRTEDVNEVRKLAKVVKMIEDRGKVNERFEKCNIIRVVNCGTGDRACVDCSTNFVEGEGMLIGNFASGLFLVHSECLSGEGYVNSRPFRVNAGAVHSYVQLPNGKTGYLSELRAGENVLRVNAKGETEIATIGRVKIERRSMVLVEAACKDGKIFSCLLQNAETVRLIVNERGDAVSVTNLREGDDVMVKINDVARHTGIAIDEDTWCER